VEHDADNPRPFSTSTRHTLHAPSGGLPSIWQSVGMLTPALRAASKTIVPSGTSIFWLFINIEIIFFLSISN
jgi:hypothetical protein